MSGEIKLRFFDHIVWIDPNKAIRTEATHLIWMFGDTVEVFQKATDAVQFIEQKSNQNILVLCASREVEPCFKAFNKLPNVYPKYIVFCGTRTRATEVKTFSMSKDAVEDAYWEISDLLNGISTLDEQLLEQPQLMKAKVTIPEHKLAPVISQAEAPIFFENLKKKNQQLQAQKAKQDEKIQLILSPSSMKSQLAIKQEVKVAQKSSQEEPQESKIQIRQNAKIIWAFEEIDENERKQKQMLEKKGYPVYSYNTLQQLKFLVRDEYMYEYYLIAKKSIDIEELKTNINNHTMTIRTGAEGEGQSVSQDEVFAIGCNQIIKHLETSIKL